MHRRGIATFAFLRALGLSLAVTAVALALMRVEQTTCDDSPFPVPEDTGAGEGAVPQYLGGSTVHGRTPDPAGVQSAGR